MTAVAESCARSIDTILAEARTRLSRLDPVAAHDALSRGAVLVDIRRPPSGPPRGRSPGRWSSSATCSSGGSTRAATRGCATPAYDLEVIVLCQEGYTSSLAADALQDLGLHRATDVDGGFAAWRAAGLPNSPTLAPSRDRVAWRGM